MITEQRVKDLVRRRDGFRCVQCNLTDEDHYFAHGVTLHVHRVTPGSPYTVEGCVTLCLSCHDKAPRLSPSSSRLPRPAQPIRARCELDDAELKAVEIAATACRLSVASFIRVVLVEAAANVEEKLEAWQEVAARLAHGTGTEPPKKPGRPKGKGKKS